MAVKGKNTKKVPNLRFPGFDDEWTTETLGKVMDFKVTNSFSRDQLNYESGSVRNIHYGDIHTKFHTLFDISEEIVPFVNEDVSIERINKDNYCKEGDMVFADASEDLNDVGKSIEIVNLNNEKLLSGLHTILARPIPNKFHTGFNGYLFKSKNIRTQIQKEAQGTKVLSISASRIGKINLTYPSIEEQSKITSVLSLIDSRISTQNKIIKELESLKKTICKRIFNQHFRFKASNGSIFPPWKIKKIGEVCEIVGGGTPETNRGEYWNGEIQWFTPTEIKSNYVSHSERTITAMGLKNSSAKILPKGAILLTTRATIGEAAIAIKECCTNQGFQSLIPKEGINNLFVLNWIRVNKHELIKRANGSTFKEVSKTEIENIEINIPTSAEQNLIANLFSSFDLKIENEKLILEKYHHAKKCLLNNLFI